MNIEFNKPVGDLDLAVQWEISHLMRKAKGDRTAAIKLALGMLVERDIISTDELRQIEQVIDVGEECGHGKVTAESAYIRVRRIHYELLRSPNPSPVAVQFASTAAGSYISVDESGDEPKVVYAKSNRSWQDTGQAVGTAVGSIWGAGGALIGGAIGGAVGKAVDECLD